LLSVSFTKELRGFSLSVSFSSSALVSALFAPSGSGKTLTLKAIAGLVKPDWGKIAVGGEVFFDSERGINLSPQERRVGFLFQDYALFPHLTVRENVAFGAKSREKVEELLSSLRIEEIADRYPSQISGGQKQRVALARALAIEPRLLLLDEPFSAIDAPLKEELYGELLKVLEEFKIPTLLVSHDVGELFRLSEWIVVMRRGRVIGEGSPSLLFLSPPDLESARLLGHVNIFKIRERRGDLAILESGRRLRVSNLSRGGKYLSILPTSAVSPALAPEENRLKLKVIKSRHFKGVFITSFLFEGREVELHLPSSLFKEPKDGSILPLGLSPESLFLLL